MSAARKQSTIEEEITKLFGTNSFRNWPPTQTIRDDIINRLIKGLTEIIHIPTTEADVIARRFEKEALTAAGSSSAPAAGIFDVYMEEIRNRFMKYCREIWPPTQEMREAMVKGLIEAFSAILKIPTTVADVIFRQVEEEAFNVVSGSYAPATGDDGMERFMVYYEEMSKRWVEKLFPTK